MRFIRKNIKLIIGIIIGITITSCISAYATYTYFADEVKYTDNKSVKQALDELYAMKNSNAELDNLKKLLNQTNATSQDILNGKIAYSGGNLITGTLNTEKNWTLVISYKIYLGWNGNTGYGYNEGKITVKNKNGNRTIVNSGGSLTSATENWNGNYSINSNIADVKIESFTIDE